MIKLIQYFFYVLYSNSLSNGENSSFWAKNLVSLILFFNVGFVLNILLILTNQTEWTKSIFFLFLIITIVAILNHLILSKEEEIMRYFKKNKKNRILLRISLILYIILSVYSFFYIIIEVKDMNTNV